jgi:hypothetical protein
MDLYIVITGNPVDGLTHYGPFSQPEADEFASELHAESWWIVPLHTA